MRLGICSFGLVLALTTPAVAQRLVNTPAGKPPITNPFQMPPYNGGFFNTPLGNSSGFTNPQVNGGSSGALGNTVAGGIGTGSLGTGGLSGGSSANLFGSNGALNYMGFQAAGMFNGFGGGNPYMQNPMMNTMMGSMMNPYSMMGMGSMMNPYMMGMGSMGMGSMMNPYMMGMGSMGMGSMGMGSMMNPMMGSMMNPMMMNPMMMNGYGGGMNPMMMNGYGGGMNPYLNRLATNPFNPTQQLFP